MGLQDARVTLSNALFQGATLRELVTLCAQLMGTPIRFTFHNQVSPPIFTAGYPHDDLVQWQKRSFEHGTANEDYLTFLSASYSARNSAHPILYLDPLLSRRRYLCLCMTGGKRAGHLTIPEESIPLEQIDTELVMLCSQFVAIACFLGGGFSDSGDREAMALLLSGNAVSYRQVANCAHVRVLPENGAFRLMICRFQNELRPQADYNPINALSCLAHTDWLHTEHDRLTLLFEASVWNEGMISDLEPLKQQFHFCCCISPEYHHLPDTSLWQKSLSSHPLFLRAKPGETVMYELSGDLGLLAQSGFSCTDMQRFIYPPLLKLQAFDKENGTSLLLTLRTFLECQMNRKRTADALFLHVNTLYYRLNRIEEILGHPLSEPDVFWAVSVGLRLLFFIETAQMN